jgi:hypothetical protein
MLDNQSRHKRSAANETETRQITIQRAQSLSNLTQQSKLNEGESLDPTIGYQLGNRSLDKRDRQPNSVSIDHAQINSVSARSTLRATTPQG